MMGVLYDFDGLLIDSETAGLASWQEVYERFGHILDIDYWLSEVGAGRGPCMPTAQLEALVGEPIDWPEVEKARLRRRDELLIARPGVRDHLVDAARLGLATGIVSNAPDWWIDQQLVHTDLAEHAFGVVITKSAGLARKPAPDAYLAALEALGLTPSGAVAFEDSPIGIASAHAAGLKCVAVPNAVTARFDLGAADLVLPALNARPLADVLAELLPDHRSVMG